MILEYQSIDINEFKVFEKVRFTNTERFSKPLDNEACFMFLVEGTFNVRTPTQLIPVTQSEGFLSRCGSYFFEELPQQSETEVVEAVGVYFHPAIVQELFKAHPIAWNTPIRHQINIDPLLEHYKQSLLYYLDHQHLFTKEMQLLKVKELLLLLSQSSVVPSLRHFISALFSKEEFDFRQVIEKNMYTTLSISELAYLCNTSLPTFKRRFKEIFRSSPAEYLKTKKLEKASALLGSTSDRVTDILFDCGFESISTFNRLFKNKFGVSPTVYRLSYNE